LDGLRILPTDHFSGHIFATQLLSDEKKVKSNQIAGKKKNKHAHRVWGMGGAALAYGAGQKT